LGMADEPAIQLDLIRAALGMLETATEPTIEDYPVEATEAGPEAWACPLNLAVEPDDALSTRLLGEVGRLRPWAAETRRRRGRTLFGLSGADPDQVDEVAGVLAEVAESGDVGRRPEVGIEWSHEMPFLLRHVADDLRSFYHEAIAAQPGDTPPNHDALNAWIFGDTVLGEVLILIGDHLTAAGDQDRMAILVRNFIIPERHYRGVANFEGLVRGRTPDLS
ncbi:MAG: hypothetical protein AAF480_12570, partial [Actinomycetota bacterium]